LAGQTLTTTIFLPILSSQYFLNLCLIRKESLPAQRQQFPANLTHPSRILSFCFLHILFAQNDPLKSHLSAAKGEEPGLSQQIHFASAVKWIFLPRVNFFLSCASIYPAATNSTMVGTSCKQPQRQPQRAGMPTSSNVRGPQKQQQQHQQQQQQPQKQQHQHSHRQHHPKKFSANGIPAIQITQMTMDEGDEEPSGTPPMQQPVKKGSDSSADARTESTSVDARSPKLECHADNAGMPEAGHLIYPKQSSGSGAQTADNSALLSANKYQDRSAVNRQSTGTLNR
jgi:hypothetical protein